MVSVSQYTTINNYPLSRLMFFLLKKFKFGYSFTPSKVFIY